MTFQEFQLHCSQAVTTNQPVGLASPIIIGEGEDRAYISDTLTHHLIIFKTPPDNAALRDIYKTVRFSFDAQNNQTVIQPLTTGA